MDENNRPQKRKGEKWEKVAIWSTALVLTIVAVILLLLLIPRENVEEVDKLLQEEASIRVETEPDLTEIEEENCVPMPEVDVQLLSKNEYSRPGKKVKRIEKIVIHYLANPKTSAQQNHDYFESLKELKNASMSANFIVGIDGEIIECVPPGEIAYASNNMNERSVSIENCHLDDTGRFTEATYESLVHLTAWLVEEYHLERDDIIRHYDVTGKECPLYYVENEDKWEAFKDRVMQYIEDSRKN